MTKLVLLWTGWDAAQYDATWTFRNDPPSDEEFEEAIKFLRMAQSRVERHRHEQQKQG